MHKIATSLSLLVFASLVHATTLIVFYDSANGAIIATDSSVTEASAGQFESDNLHGSGTQCKIDRCGKYWMASAGIDVTGNNEITRVCSVISDAQGIDGVLHSVEMRGVEQATRLASDLIRDRNPLKYRQHVFSLVMAGYESGRPVLRYREVRFMGTRGSQALFKVTRKIACPGSGECKELRIGTGLFDDIETAKNRGKYPKTKNPLQLAKELVEIEIEAHRKDRLVAGPVSVIQIKGSKPTWFKGGLCHDSE